MPGPWSALEAVRGLVNFRSDWHLLAGAQFEALRLLCLQPSALQPESYPCPVHCGCWHRIIRRHDSAGAIGACQCDPPACPDFPLTIEDVTPLEVNRARLGRAVCKALTLSSKPTDLALPFTSQIGSWSANAVPAILTILPDHEAFRRVVPDLVATLNQPFILLAPTANHLDVRCQQHLARVRAAFFPLETTVTLSPGGILTPTRPLSELFARFNPQPSTINSQLSTTHTPRYLLRKGLGVWKLIFDGQEAILKHERGIFYVAWLLYNPPEHPIHAIDLMAKIPEIYRQQLGLAPLVDPVTGKTAPLQSGARIQERSLALDDAQSMRVIYKKEKELETILDSDDASEPEKVEALRELEEIAEFQKHHTRRSQDSARNAADAVRKAIRRLQRNLARALDPKGDPHPVLRPFALHLQKHLLIPSARYPSHHAPPSTLTTLNHRLAGCLTYEPPPSVSWPA